MAKIESVEALNALRDRARRELSLRIKGDRMEEMIQVFVGMDDCGIAAGAEKIMDAFLEETETQGIENVLVMKTGCMGHCSAEPMAQILVPGREPVVYGNLTAEKVKELVGRYIKNGETVEGAMALDLR